MPYFDPGTGDHVVIDGLIVERDALSIVERIKEYDEDLEVVCLDPVMAGPNDAPFILLWKRPTGEYVRVFEFWELNETIIQRIYASDQRRFDALDRTIKMEEYQKKQREDRYKDKVAETADLLAYAMKNRTSSYTFKNHEDELVKVKDDAPVEKNNGRFFSYAR